MYMDTDIINQARKTDMIDFLTKRNGFTFISKSGGYRCEQHPSLAVENNRLSWYWFSKDIGGRGVFDYLIKIEGMDFKTAFESVEGKNTFIQAAPQKEKPPVKLILPEKKGIAINLYKYLCITRGINNYIVNTLHDEGKIYENKDGNLVFVAYDENNNPKFASVRCTHAVRNVRWDCAGSDKRYGFNMTYSHTSRLYIFESPIDAMSHASLEIINKGDNNAWKQQNRLSLSGISDKALSKYLEMHPFTKELVFCLDYDEPGIEAAEKLTKKYADDGFSTKIEQPTGKDFNDDLLAVTAQKRAEKSTKKHHNERDI